MPTVPSTSKQCRSGATGSWRRSKAEGCQAPPLRATDLNLQKALWLNIAELKLAENSAGAGERLQRLQTIGIVAAVVLGGIVAILLLVFW